MFMLCLSSDILKRDGLINKRSYILHKAKLFCFCGLKGTGRDLHVPVNAKSCMKPTSRDMPDIKVGCKCLSAAK